MRKLWHPQPAHHLTDHGCRKVLNHGRREPRLRPEYPGRPTRAYLLNLNLNSATMNAHPGVGVHGSPIHPGSVDGTWPSSGTRNPGKRRRAQAGDPGRVVGYVRVSTDRQDHGPVAQRNALETWCEARGALLVAVHEDIGASGGAALDKRPGLASAVDAVRQHGAGVFLAAKRDRIARDTVIAAVVGRLVERNGGRVLTADGVASADTPEGKLMATMIDAFAEYERMLIKMRTKAALAVKRQRGQRVGSIPYGYQLDHDGTTLIEHPDEQAVIQTLAELRSRMSLRATVAYCRKHGISARNGQWWPSTVQRVLARHRRGRDGGRG